MLGGLTNPASAEVKVIIEGAGDEYPHYLDMRVAPEIKDEIIMVPLQDIADGMSWTVTGGASTCDIGVQGNGRLLQMTLGKQQAVINSLPVNMPVPPCINDASIMIPLSFVSQSLGYHVESSKIWNNLDQIYVTPYSLISDAEIAHLSEVNFSRAVDSDGFITFQLKKDGKTAGGIRLNSSIWDVLQVYGVPRSPVRNLNYAGDWTGKLIYWGTFVPSSGMGTFYEFTFEQGSLVDMTIED
jgi:hypothetical protein